MQKQIFNQATGVEMSNKKLSINGCEVSDIEMILRTKNLLLTKCILPTQVYTADKINLTAAKNSL